MVRASTPPPSLSITDRETAHAAAMARGADCRACPLFGCGRGPVLAEVRSGTALTVISEGPGDQEVEDERPFVGWPGQVLESALASAGLTRRDISVTQATLCQPPPEGYKALTDFVTTEWRRRRRRAEFAGQPVPPQPKLPHEACFPRLVRDLTEARAATYLAVGSVALTQVAGVFGVKAASISQQHGAPITLPDGATLMSSYHPAMARYGRREYMGVIYENLQRAAHVARHGGRFFWEEPPFDTSPTPDECLRFLRRLRETNAETACDIETDGLDLFDAKIRCIGLSAVLDGRDRTLVIPINGVNGLLWWPRSVAEPIWYALREVLDNNPLIFHNGPFDTAKLINAGLMTNRKRSWKDTLALHKDTTDSDLEHSLSFAARRIYCLPMWKADVDRKHIKRVNDSDLRLYNARDTRNTRLIAGPLTQWVERAGNVAQAVTDHALLPVIRDMGLHGIPVDEHRRGAFSEELNWYAQRELYKLKSELGPKFNPRSAPQVQELLYNDWGLKPPSLEEEEDAADTLAVRDDWRTQILRELDYETEIEEVGSTSSAAIMAHVKAKSDALTPARLETLKTLLEFRAYDKLRSTYTDNMKVRACEEPGVERAKAVSVYAWDEASQDYVEVERLPERSGMSVWHVQYKLGPPTGRLASSPNAQNIPAAGKLNLRKLFRAPPGHVYIGADYEQLEARIYAAVANDVLLLQAIRDGKDIHSMNAAALRARTLDDIETEYKKVEHGEKAFRKYWRNVAKRFCFLEIYGGSMKKLFSVMAVQRNRDDGKLSFPDLTPDDVKRWHENWHKLHPETARFHEMCHAEVRATGAVRVPDLDRRARWFLHGASQPNAIPNMKIQGFASSIANQALLRLTQALPWGSLSRWTGVNLQVHDFIGGLIPDTEQHRKWAGALWKEAMFHSFQDVPFPAKPEFGYYWNELDV